MRWLDRVALLLLFAGCLDDPASGAPAADEGPSEEPPLQPEVVYEQRVPLAPQPQPLPPFAVSKEWKTVQVASWIEMDSDASFAYQLDDSDGRTVFTSPTGEEASVGADGARGIQGPWVASGGVSMFRDQADMAGAIGEWTVRHTWKGTGADLVLRAEALP